MQSHTFLTSEERKALAKREAMEQKKRIKMRQRMKRQQKEMDKLVKVIYTLILLKRIFFDSGVKSFNLDGGFQCQGQEKQVRTSRG